MNSYFIGLFTVGYGFCIISIIMKEYIMGLVILGSLFLIGMIIQTIVDKQKTKKENKNE